jgi:hypothetical protein
VVNAVCAKTACRTALLSALTPLRLPPKGRQTKKHSIATNNEAARALTDSDARWLVLLPGGRMSTASGQRLH